MGLNEFVNSLIAIRGTVGWLVDVVVLVDHVPGEKINVDKQIFTSEEQRAAGGGGRRSTVRSIMQRFQDGLLDMSIKQN